MQTRISDHYSHDLYMQLPDVVEADRFVRTSGQFDAYMDAAASIFFRHTMESRFGVCLLHRHHDLRRDEVMVEDRRYRDGRDALVTSPRRERAGVAASWHVVDGRLHALEFTTDDRARACLDDGSVPADFLQEFADLGNVSPLGRYLGLAVVERALYDTFADDEQAMEYTSHARRSSVVFGEKIGTMEIEPVQTAWRFRRPAVETMAKCLDTRGCKKFCREDSSPDIGHVERHKPGEGEHIIG